MTSSNGLAGEIITWDIPGSEVELNDVITAFTDAGLGNPDEYIKEMRPSTAFGRATKALRQKDERLVQKVEDDKGITKYQVTLNAKNADRIHHQYEALLTLDRNSGSIGTPDAHATSMAAIIERDYHTQMERRNSADISRLVQKLFSDRADLFPINPRKGVAYFVPSAHADFTEKVQRFLEAMGGSLSRFPVPEGDHHGKKSIAAAVKDGIEKMLSELDESTETFSDSTRTSTLDRAQERWEAISVKLDAYNVFLADQADLVAKRLQESRKRLVEKASAISAAKE